MKRARVMGGGLGDRAAAPSGRGVVIALLFLSTVTLVAPAHAFVLAEDPFAESSTVLGISLRTFTFLFTSPILRPPYVLEDANPSAAAFADLRLSFAHKREHWQIVAHGQLTPRISSVGEGVGLVGMGRGAAPSRWLLLRAWIARADRVSVLASLDWLYLRLTFGPVTITLGRQPVTLGRGQLWHPLDMISMFSLTEVDREIKPGVDALRLDWQVASRSSLMILAVGGELADDTDAELSLRGSSFLLRFKQGMGPAEIGLVAGLVRRDVVAALDGMVDLGFGDLYGEVVLNLPSTESLTPRPGAICAHSFPPLYACEGTVPSAIVRAMVGLRLKPASTLTVSAEAFYNGFGSFDRARYLSTMASERVALGEVVGLGALYGGAFFLWEVHPLVKLQGALLSNLADPSALLSLGMSYNAAANVDILGGFYLPVGRLPDIRQRPRILPRDEYGLYPTFFYLEVKVAI